MNLFWFGLVCFYFFILVQTTGATLIEQIVYKRKLTFFWSVSLGLESVFYSGWAIIVGYVMAAVESGVFLYFVVCSKLTYLNWRAEIDLCKAVGELWQSRWNTQAIGKKKQLHCIGASIFLFLFLTCNLRHLGNSGARTHWCIFFLSSFRISKEITVSGVSDLSQSLCLAQIAGSSIQEAR